MKNKSIAGKPIILKSILDILLIWLIIIMVVTFFLSIYLIFIQEVKFPFTLFEYEITEWTTVPIILVVLQFLLYIGFIYTIYLFRKLVRLFFKNKLFTRLQIASLNLIGQLILWLSILQVIFDFFARMFLESKVGISTGIAFFDSFWFIICIGMFFIYLSQIFDNARILKEENDLTV